MATFSYDESHVRAYAIDRHRRDACGSTASPGTTIGGARR
jgi:hypothetical protein